MSLEKWGAKSTISRGVSRHLINIKMKTVLAVADQEKLNGV
jgi:hypothetical protein